jgi:ribosomal protein L37AE/L43A
VSFRVPDLRRDLTKTTGDRFRCPLCDARRGLSLEQDEGQTGVWHCFSCQAGGTGAELYAELHHVGIAEALDAFGVSGSDVAREVQAREKARPRPSWDPSGERMTELYHAWKAMEPEELKMRDEYRAKRIAAAQRKDQEAFDYWHEKWTQLHRFVLDREMAGHQQAAFIDANTDHLA